MILLLSMIFVPFKMAESQDLNCVRLYYLRPKVPKLNLCNIYLKDFLQRIILDMLTIMEVNVKTKPPKIYQNDNNLYS